jgi:hypothetical protein
VSEDAGIEPRTVATLALAVICSNHSARSHLTRLNVVRQKIVDFSNLIGVYSLVVQLLSVPDRYKTIYHCFHRGLECWERRGGTFRKVMLLDDMYKLTIAASLSHFITLL